MTHNLLPGLQIVAEVAQGFEGNPAQAALLIRAAAKSGADAVKFQLVFADELATPDYQYYDLFRGLEMSDETWQSLADQCRAEGIALQVDIFGRRSLDLAARIGVETVKLHGTDIANPGLLRDVAASSVPQVMLGAGGAHLDEIDTALAVLADKKVVVLLGFQAYPTPTDTNQIDRVGVLCERFADASNVTVGFADHADPENALRMALAAAALGKGARVIEKHLTLGRNMELEDFESALNPDQFAEFATTLRGVDSALGVTADSADFGMSEAEKSYRKMIRRHVVSAHALQAGQLVEASDLVLKRAAIGNPLTDLDQSIGHRLVRDVAANSPLRANDLEG
ncbi:MAG: N-acetylneuraminate synthase family protein [Rhizobiales bacterium]|nr:N-acetylneuraminate synthase family protein [Hyphomicrobiales bacterium]MBO6698955.1 N-acetylneuraminate synthase family protein [Hyphomicrobiales bacterium]MBO6734792.1 N-acetylneuraminate synthase family protein [Hyphomicrobiales bacterium]MBO6911402.1 N-acetylneuraminate synthase family protein [Hyphomicrobiales bacterium]MBO6955465.1 N-acetylneuraminate synthase family protein [Hyphomicrobiales bacterium]